MPSLNLDLAFFEHRKVIRLISLAGRGSDANLLRLWCYCGRHHPQDGLLTGYSPEEIESLAGWSGKTGVLHEALLKVKLLDSVEDGYRIHDWTEHAGHLWAYSERARAMANAKWSKLKKEKEEYEKYAASIATACVEHATRDAKAKQSKAKQIPPSTTTPPVELPPGFPATIEEARAHAQFVGVPEDICDAEWNRAFSRGGTDSKGIAIGSWRHFIQAVFADRKSRKEERANGHTGSRPSVADERNRFIGTAGCEDDSADIPFQ